MLDRILDPIVNIENQSIYLRIASFIRNDSNELSAYIYVLTRDRARKRAELIFDYYF